MELLCFFFNKICPALNQEYIWGENFVRFVCLCKVCLEKNQTTGLRFFSRKNEKSFFFVLQFSHRNCMKYGIYKFARALLLFFKWKCLWEWSFPFEEQRRVLPVLKICLPKGLDALYSSNDLVILGFESIPNLISSVKIRHCISLTCHSLLKTLPSSNLVLLFWRVPMR